MPPYALGLEVLDEQEEGDEALLGGEELGGGEGTLWLRRLLMAREALKTGRLSAKTERKVPSTSSMEVSRELRISISCYNYLPYSIRYYNPLQMESNMGDDTRGRGGKEGAGDS